MTDEAEQRKIFQYLMDSSIMIGSRAWGGFGTDSDYDIVMSVERYKKVKVMLIKNGFNFHMDHGASSNPGNHKMFNKTNDKVWIAGNEVNILTYPEKDLQKIEELNKIMGWLGNTTVGKRMKENKRYRIDMVETLLNTLFNNYRESLVDFSFMDDSNYNPDDKIPF